MILPPPKFLNAMPERGTGKPRASTFRRDNFSGCIYTGSTLHVNRVRFGFVCLEGEIESTCLLLKGKV